MPELMYSDVERKYYVALLRAIQFGLSKFTLCRAKALCTGFLYGFAARYENRFIEKRTDNRQTEVISV
jgi:hypothetical protein